LSILFTLNEQVELLPQASVAVSVITVSPVPVKVVPAAGDCVTVTGKQLELVIADDE
jgi:hypothetical protein